MITSGMTYDRSQLTDTDSGLYNRLGFEILGPRVLAESLDTDFAVIRLDIFRYRMVREYVGYLESARLISYIGNMIDAMAKERWVCAHFGGDSYALIVPFDTINEVFQVVEEIIYNIKSFRIQCKILPAVGICIVGDHSDNLEYLLDCAKIALDTVKGNFITHYAVFNTKIRREILANRKIETKTTEALKTGQFKAYFQPQVDLRTGKMLGIEALARWEKPGVGIIYPEEFLPVFESNGFILDMDFVIWEDAFAQKSRWFQMGIDIPYLAINISSVHRMDKYFVRRLHELVMKYRLDPTKIALDLNEYHYAYDLAERYESLMILKRLGYIISFDDFGGESISVSILTKFDLDMVSLDRAFILEINANDKSNLVVRSAILLFQELGIRLIAEGVETQEQVDFLLEYGCNLGQGYFYHKPMSAYDLEEKIQSGEINY